MNDYASTYRALRGRVSDLVRAADDEQLEALAPAAPEWRARDLVAHLCGVTADVNAGNLDGVATDAWTARQVDARRDRSIEQILGEWDTEGAKIEALMPDMPQVAVGQMLFDAVTHEHDIRGALGQSGGRDSDALTMSFDWGLDVVSGMVDDADATLRVDTGPGSRTIGGGSRELGVRADRFDLFRAMTGRRSLEQLRAFDWAGEPAPELLVLPIFTCRSAPLDE